MKETGMHTTLLLALALASAGLPVAAQITVVKPLDPVPPRRLEYHAPQLLSCPATQYPDSLKRRAIGGHGAGDKGVDTLGGEPRYRKLVGEGPPPRRLPERLFTPAGGACAPPPGGRDGV